MCTDTHEKISVNRGIASDTIPKTPDTLSLDLSLEKHQTSSLPPALLTFILNNTVVVQRPGATLRSQDKPPLFCYLGYKHSGFGIRHSQAKPVSSAAWIAYQNTSAWIMATMENTEKSPSSQDTINSHPKVRPFEAPGTTKGCVIQYLPWAGVPEGEFCKNWKIAHSWFCGVVSLSWKARCKTNSLQTWFHFLLPFCFQVPKTCDWHEPIQVF